MKETTIIISNKNIRILDLIAKIKNRKTKLQKSVDAKAKMLFAK